MNYPPAKADGFSAPAKIKCLGQGFAGSRVNQVFSQKKDLKLR